MDRCKRSLTDYYHVIIKGNNSEYIYKDDEDKKYFIKLLFLIAYQEKSNISAWCVMDNHVHILIKIDFDKFTRFFKRLNLKYSKYYHKKYEVNGYIYKRLKTITIDSEEQLICNMRYIHQNPVKANMVEEERDYNWSSYNSYLAKDIHPYLKYVKNIVGSDNEVFIDFHKIY